jgi:hypothetical protein
MVIGLTGMFLVCSFLGCSGYVKRGSALYAEGRYIEAAEVFERTEGRLAESTPREKAEYALYRGMTLLVLGDLRNSHRWPGSLHQDTRALLDRSWYDLGQKLNPTAAPPPRAVAASQPPPPIPPPEPLPKRDAPSSSKNTLVPQ